MNRLLQWAEASRYLVVGVALATAACSSAPAANPDAAASATDVTNMLTFPDSSPGATAGVDVFKGDSAADAPQSDADSAPDADAPNATPDAVAEMDAAADAQPDGGADVQGDAPSDTADAGCAVAACPASGGPCTVAICLADGTCGFAPANDGAPCNDANACTAIDSCTGGACVGSLVNCDDGNSCTIDSCKTPVGCVHAFEFAPCEDGDGCTTNDQCMSGVCTSGAATVCTPSDPCQQAGTCEPATGICPFGAVPNGTACGASSVCMVGKCTIADAMPVGALAWFATADCPTGWEPHADSVGRTLVAGDGVSAGQLDGTPLAPGEDRTHSHAVTGSITTNTVAFAGIAGCCNGGLSASGTWDVTGSALAASSGIPYVQLRGCKKTTAIAYGSAPSDLLAFIDGATCPTGWLGAYSASKRFIIGISAGGSNGATFGGAWALPHSHSVNAAISLASHGIGLASGGGGGGYAAAGEINFSSTSNASVSSFPSLTRLACAPSLFSAPGPVPSGLVAFFTSAACPDGWSAATSVAGRLVVGAATGTDVGVQVGAPLADKEDRSHTHGVLVSVQPPAKSVAGANGGNGQAADNGQAKGTGTSGAAPSGMPFVQWLVCQKN